MKTQVTELHKSPAQPLQCLGSLGTFWKALCPFWLSWALASPCSHSGKTEKVFLYLTVQNEDLCRTHEHALTILSSAGDSHWCAKVALELVCCSQSLYNIWAAKSIALRSVRLFPMPSSVWGRSKPRCQRKYYHHPHCGSVWSWGTLHPSDGI